MPLYMDVHRNLHGISHEDVAKAHEQDQAVQGKYNVTYLQYWFNEDLGAVYCLALAPSKDAAIAVHRESNELIPAEIIEVHPGNVAQFLGAEESDLLQDKELVAERGPEYDTAFRAIMFSDMEGSTSQTQRLGDARAVELLRVHDKIIDDALRRHSGSRVKHMGDGVMASFGSVSRALECAIRLQREFDSYGKQHPLQPMRIRIGCSAGEPVAENNDLFGATVQLASRLCARADPCQILVSSVVHDLCLGKDYLFADLGHAQLRGFDEPVRLYEVRWQG